MSHARAIDGANGTSALAKDADEINASNDADARATSRANRAHDGRWARGRTRELGGREREENFKNVW